MQNGRFFSYLNTAERLVGEYRGGLPLHHFLRSFFREHAKYGSKDRKAISRLCYAYYRTGQALKDAEVKDKILASVFLLGDEYDPMLAALRPEWGGHVEDKLEDKLHLLNSVGLQVRIDEIFPLKDRLSDLIPDNERFILSHLVQPRLFLRVRPGREGDVESALIKARIPYNIFDHTIELANGTDVAGVLEIEKDIVVQDLSSQRTGEFIQKALSSAGQPARVWDCCAASGGKSIMAYDLDPTIELTVSDIRPSILENLSERFRRAGIRKFHSSVADLSNNRRTGLFELVIADVPCSGSGTWGRTPEEMSFFSSADLDRYTATQISIVKNIAGNVKPGGTLLYFTCSVYRDENEGMVERIKSETELELTAMKLIPGWDSRADSMFVASFRQL